MSDRCRWFTEPDGFRWHYPGCMGCVVYGHDRCTCTPTGHNPDELIHRIRRLEGRVARLEGVTP